LGRRNVAEKKNYVSRWKTAGRRINTLPKAMENQYRVALCSQSTLRILYTILWGRLQTFKLLKRKVCIATQAKMGYSNNRLLLINI
jgi:hypothetical protein